MNKVKAIEIEWNEAKWNIDKEDICGQTLNQTLINDPLLGAIKGLGWELGRIIKVRDDLWHTITNRINGMAGSEEDAKALVERQLCAIEVEKLL